MKVAKNMDSVFANCTEDELDFDLLFSNDDTIIDFIAGVDEAGIPFTGPNYDYSKLNEAEDMLEDEDDLDERLGKIKHNGSFEGTEDDDLEIGAEIGDGKEVSGREHSAESDAHDMVELGSETAKSKAREKAMQIGVQKYIDSDSVKENCDYFEYASLIENVINGYMTEEQILDENATYIAISIADSLIQECEDAAAREGKVDKENSKYIEGAHSKAKDIMIKGKASGDNFEDPCDCESRLGKNLADTKNIEGVASRIIGAAMEAVSSGNLDLDIDEETIDHDETEMDKYIVPDSVRDDSDRNQINIAQEASKFVKDRYASLLRPMNKELQDLAMATCLDESVVITASAIKEAAFVENCSYRDYSQYQDIVEAVISNLNPDQLELENCAEFVLEAADYIIKISEDITFDTVEIGKNKFANKTPINMVKSAAYKTTVGAKNHHPVRAGLVAAGGVAAAGALAKSIADKKKAAARVKEDVQKENYEYPEYDKLLETIINSFTEEEVMNENSSEMAINIADILIEKAENGDAIYDDPDGDDIEDVAKGEGEDDPHIEYNYDDDELIDIVIYDDEI